MSMLGAGELCRAILEDKEMARAFDIDSDGEMDLMASYLRASEHANASRLRIVSIHGDALGGSRSLATLGIGGSITP
jgi:hypothetical protein